MYVCACVCDLPLWMWMLIYTIMCVWFSSGCKVDAVPWYTAWAWLSPWLPEDYRQEQFLTNDVWYTWPLYIHFIWTPGGDTICVSSYKILQSHRTGWWIREGPVLPSHWQALPAPLISLWRLPADVWVCPWPARVLDFWSPLRGRSRQTLVNRGWMQGTLWRRATTITWVFR